MKKIHLLHYLLLCYMVLAVATSCGDDEDDYAPDNVNDPEKRSSLPGRTLTGFSRIPICWLTSRICSISGAS